MEIFGPLTDRRRAQASFDTIQLIPITYIRSHFHVLLCHDSCMIHIGSSGIRAYSFPVSSLSLHCSYWLVVSACRLDWCPDGDCHARMRGSSYT